jgi:hypothetical protein
VRITVDKAQIVRVLRYYSAHTAAFGGIAAGLALVFSGHPLEAVPTFVAALAGFGLAIKPADQP